MNGLPNRTGQDPGLSFLSLIFKKWNILPASLYCDHLSFSKINKWLYIILLLKILLSQVIIGIKKR
jgi:hypothetical protein